MTVIVVIAVMVVVFRAALWFGGVWVTGAEAEDEHSN